MTEKRDRLLSNAGGLLIAAGAVGAFVGGSYGLAEQRPGLIITSVVLLMGYGVVGYLLMNRGERYFHYMLPAAAVLVVATLFLFQTEMRSFLEAKFSHYVLEPSMTLLLVFAGGALLTHVVENMTDRVVWPSRGARSLNTLLHVAAFAPVWCAFTLVDMMGRSASAWSAILIIGGSALVGIACVVGGYAASRNSHPAFTAVGASLGFLAAASYLYQFMAGRGDVAAAAFGQFIALLGLILCGLPAAISAVAWIQVANERASPEPVDPTP
ncbi:MAG TPA: hypothetical protein VFH78_15835 [Candidatus Thermoplasmatota archaeon]|nr:hypothetical protein [Candidatus Thermoplasmatota archaeon]